MVKKLFIFSFILLSLLLSAVLLVPVFFDANKHLKPYIERTIAQKLDVEPRLGKMAVSLWGTFSVDVSSVDLIDNQTKKSVFRAQGASIEVPIPPLFGKQVNLTLIARAPQISAIKLRDGKFNFLRLLKAESSSEGSTTPPPAAAPLAFMKDFKVSVTVKVEDAKIEYRDDLKGTVTAFSNLDFLVQDFSLEEPFRYSLTAKLNSRQGEITIAGPTEVSGSLKLIKTEGNIIGVETTGKINLDSLELDGGSFKKQKGEPLNFGIAGYVTTDDAKLIVDSNVDSIQAKSEITVRSFSPLNAVIMTRAPKIDLAAVMKSKAKLTDLNLEAYVTDDTFKIREVEFKAFKGRYSGSAEVNYKKSDMPFTHQGSFGEIDIDEALASQAPDLKGTLVGRLGVLYKFRGFGSSAEDIKKNLTGDGNILLKDGSWSALYALRVIGEKLNEIPGAREKVGNLKVGDKIQTGQSSFRIAKQTVHLQNTVIDMKDSKATITGGGEIGFNKQMRFKGFLIAPLGSPPPALRNPDGRAKLPFELTGSVTGPNVNWNIITDAVAKAYLKQEGQKAIENLIKDNIKDENVKKIIEQVAPEGLDKLLKDIKL